MLEITESLLRLRDIGPGPKLLFVLLDNLSKGGGSVLDHTQLQLSEMLGISRQSVNYDIQRLVDAGFIAVTDSRPPVTLSCVKNLVTQCQES